MYRSIITVVMICLATVFAPLHAEQSQRFGDYTVHYSAFTTDILTKEVARAYKIPRSKNRALLNISVLKKVMETTGAPVRAEIQATATNLNAQLRELKVRELSEYGAIYYIAETTIDHKETLKYELTITPEGEEKSFSLSFQQQFFAN